MGLPFVRLVQINDIAAMIMLSDCKRKAYARIHQQFWRPNPHANGIQSTWFKELLLSVHHLILVAEKAGSINGFIIGQLMDAPAVYDPGGLTLMVDDFCVADPTLWPTIGTDLLTRLTFLAREKGAVQVVVVSGQHDEPKRQVLMDKGFVIASEWYVQSLNASES